MSQPFVGEIRLFGFGRVPNGWFACDGSLQSIAEYEVLYALIGTTYGGDGSSTFAVPDLRSRIPIHMGQGPGLSPYVLGQTSGTESVTLIQQQMPAHGHTLLATTELAGATQIGVGVELGALNGDAMYITDTSGSSMLAMNPASLTPSGGNQPHENLMPTLTALFCIAWAGIFPQQN
ncbi:phage Tail Collar domain protein [Lysobacter capsici]|uniref:Microcystin dependent protein n=1 Tax=Lysobacter capsici AZ78 TaxID=1444315 RepID=A0A125U0A5_9GAMM|nr:tail fiber protein [Lysobacter capsici]ALN86344.1 phage Tail Collar domain protein [Lysobacter capsici]KWS02540.1 Microcystin dependent protein [Lysobacter capsici AZ78]